MQLPSLRPFFMRQKVTRLMLTHQDHSSSWVESHTHILLQQAACARCNFFILFFLLFTFCMRQTGELRNSWSSEDYIIFHYYVFSPFSESKSGKTASFKVCLSVQVRFLNFQRRFWADFEAYEIQKLWSRFSIMLLSPFSLKSSSWPPPLPPNEFLENLKTWRTLR